MSQKNLTDFSQPIANFINGEEVAAVSGATLPVHCPATGAVYSTVARSGAVDVRSALASAAAAQASWAACSADDRAAVLLRVAEGIESNLPYLARAESWDNGKPVRLAASVDIPRSARNFAFFAHAATQFASEAHDSRGHLNYTLRRPLGVVSCISPWNLPLYLFTWKIAPALAAGNCVVAKPSEVTPLTASLLGPIARAAGLPPGVLNIVHGLGAEVGEELCTSSAVRAISFTGSTRTGAAIAAVAAPRFKKLSLEMGGKNATLVFADCDLDRAVSGAVRAAFSNQGQICLCGSRIYVEESIYAEFRSRFVAAAKALVVGDPEDPKTDQGAIVSQEHMVKVMEHIRIARDVDGGKVLAGGAPVSVPGRCRDGWFIAPTVLEGIKNETVTNQTEIFGPVCTLQPFAREEEALRLANQSEYGLAATVWTSNLQRAVRVAEGIEAGMVWVNDWMPRDLRTPFGGIKNSGIGREGGWEAMRFFTEAKNICLSRT